MSTDPKKKSLADLAALRDQLPPGAEAPMSDDGCLRAQPAGTPPPAPPPPKGPARAVVRYERKGRKGKEATLIEKLELKPPELEAWCKALKQALGCGGAVDGATIVLQGDQRPRLEALLLERGVRKVTVAQ